LKIVECAISKQLSKVFCRVEADNWSAVGFPYLGSELIDNSFDVRRSLLVKQSRETFKTILQLNDKNNSCPINGEATFNDKQFLEINELQLKVSLRTSPKKSTNHSADSFPRSLK
jgi:hypothetical protein